MSKTKKDILLMIIALLVLVCGLGVPFLILKQTPYQKPEWEIAICVGWMIFIGGMILLRILEQVIKVRPALEKGGE